MVNPDPEALAWCKVSERFIFLDIARDRYFALADGAQHVFLERLGIEATVSWHQPPPLPRPAAWLVPQRVSHDIGEGPFRLADVAAAVWSQRRIEHRLARTSFQTVLVELRHLTEQRTQRHSTKSRSGPTVRAFEQARLLRSAADRCLPRSIALKLRLAKLRLRTHLVIGVKDRPFGAHAWVQHGDIVLNDSLEEVRRYTPILII